VSDEEGGVVIAERLPRHGDTSARRSLERDRCTGDVLAQTRNHDVPGDEEDVVPVTTRWRPTHRRVAERT